MSRPHESFGGRHTTVFRARWARKTPGAAQSESSHGCSDWIPGFRRYVECESGGSACLSEQTSVGELCRTGRLIVEQAMASCRTVCGFEKIQGGLGEDGVDTPSVYCAAMSSEQGGRGG